MAEIFWHTAADALIDSLKLFPFLLATYLALEYLEEKAGDKTVNLIRRSGRAGPLIGALCGLFPQCGLAAAASNFYAARVISAGTLIAVYLSTSDEMLPILISGGAGAALIVQILGIKVIFAIASGVLLDIFLPQKFIRHKQEPDIEAFCQREKCKCDDKDNIWHSAYKHTEKISIFIFIFSLIVNAVFAFGGRETVQLLLTGMPILSKFIAAGVGLIPSCYPSVLLTQLYLDNAITLGTMLAGTLSNAGLGYLVLYRVNPNRKENLRILALLYGLGVVFGIVAEILL